MTQKKGYEVTNNMDTKIPWYDADLEKRLELTLPYLENMLDADHDNEPFFGTDRYQDSTAGAHHALEIGIPHVTGRACDIFYGIEAATGMKLPENVEADYVRYLYSCCEVEDNLPVYYDPDKNNEAFVQFHNLRECLEALVWRIRLRDCDRARKVADGFLNTLIALTNEETGCMDYQKAVAMGKGEKFASIQIPLTMGQGRLVGPLMLFYQETGDLRALKLAQQYAESTLSICFEEDGRLRDAAHNHVHSITSTLSGILYYALCAGRGELAQKIEKICEVGLAPAMSSYGYVREQLWIESEQGESNQVGDLIQIYLMLAGMGKTAQWYGHAERFMRGGILPAQVLETDSFLKDHPNPENDSWRNMSARAIGGFGFPTPTTRFEPGKGGVNTIDITQGAAQAICAFREKIITRDAMGIHLNLLFSAKTPYADVTSHLPVEGRLEIDLKARGALWVRMPQNIEAGTFSVQCGNTALPFIICNGYAVLPVQEAGTALTISFQPAQKVEQEYIHHIPYEVHWYGEQVTDVLPHKGVAPLFPYFPKNA